MVTFILSLKKSLTKVVLTTDPTCSSTSLFWLGMVNMVLILLPSMVKSSTNSPNWKVTK